MKVYRATAYGFESTGMIIAANSIEEAHQIAQDAGMGSVLFEDVWEENELSTNSIHAGVIVQF